MRNFVPEQLAKRWARVEAEIERSRVALGVDEVHDLRVALRRYNEALRLFETWTGRRYSKGLRDRMRPLRQTAGEVRDLDVAADLLRKANSAISLDARRAGAAVMLADALAVEFDSPPPPLILTAELAAEVARASLPKAAKAYFRTGAKLRAGTPPDEQLHAFRIDGKHFRYTLEMFAPLYGPALGRRIGSLRKIQGALGDLNDCAVLSGMPEVQGDETLLGWLRERAGRKRLEFQEVWDSDFRSARLWMAYFRRWVRTNRTEGRGGRLPSA